MSFRNKKANQPIGYKGSIRPAYERRALEANKRPALTLSSLLRALESDAADLSQFGDGFTHTQARV